MFALLTLAVLTLAGAIGLAALCAVFAVAKTVLKLALFPLLVAVVLIKVTIVLFLLPLVLTIAVSILALLLAFALPVLILFGIVWGGVMVLA